METDMSSSIERACPGPVWLTALALFMTASAASADTSMMPNRAYLMGASEVVWGPTTLPNTTSTFVIDVTCQMS
jgi:hypothetical protein